jgi:16S rRNA (guanine527-N7)-methyltransferase
MSSPSGGIYPGLASSVDRLFGVTLTPGQIESFRWYSLELQRWSEHTNLTALTEPKDIEIKHFLDSLSCLSVLEGVGKLVDVGSGAGFPGIPLKIVLGELQVTLVESTRKKLDFCEHVIANLGLLGIEAVHGRAEDLARDKRYRGTFDWAVGRAVASMSVLAEYLLPFLKLGGRMIAMKGSTGPAESQEAGAALTLLGGKLSRLVPMELPTVTETRFLVVVDKVAATPDSYPRRPGIPAKRPLELTSD